MRAYNKFIKKVKKINIEVSEYRFLEGAGWVKAKDFDNLPNNLKKAYYWELESLNENKLKQLQSDAVNELSLLSDDQLKKTLKRLDFLNEFERFNEFIKSFYVKVDNNTFNGLDFSDFKILLDKCFYVDVPNKGNISIDFLTELTDQIFLNSGLLDGLKWQIENLLTKQEQTKETDYWQDDADEITLISEYEKAVNKLIKGNDAGCFPMRFRMLPRVVLYENKYSIERKKYLLKQMRLVLEGVKNTEIGNELFADLRQRVEPYEDIFSFVFTATALPPQETITENDTIRCTAKHYVLAYLIECNAKGKSLPIGQKKKLEQIGNKRMGAGKGNRFYKVFNEIVNKDLNAESDLIEIGGENWRTIVKDLSNEPETVETYLQSKQL